MEASLELFYESFITGFMLILSRQGLLFIMITIVLSVIGALFRSRGPSYLSFAMILLVLILNIHVYPIFPYDETARALISMSGSSGDPMDMVVNILAKTAYNLGLVLIPSVIYLLSGTVVGRPALE